MFALATFWRGSRLGGQFFDKLSFSLALDLSISFAVKLANVLSIVKYFPKEKMHVYRTSRSNSIIIFGNFAEVSSRPRI